MARKAENVTLCMGHNTPMLQCIGLKKESEYFSSWSQFHANGKVPYCKECCSKIFNYYLDETKSAKTALYYTLMKIDTPFIKEVYEKENYLMDTHTAVGYVVLNKYKNETRDNRQVLIVSTASPYKFPRSICRALGLDVSNKNDFEVLKLLNEYTNIEIPNNLKGLDVKKVIHNKVCNKEKMKESLLEFLKENKN